MNEMASEHPDAEPKPVRQSLGRRDKHGIDVTRQRICHSTKTDPLDVAAFQSFTE